jgi:hypothetical protein
MVMMMMMMNLKYVYFQDGGLKETKKSDVIKALFS